MGEFVRLEVEDGVGTIRLDRPPMNAINDQLTQDLQEVAVEATMNDDVRACVIWGGEKVFAAGADIKQMADASSHSMKASWTGANPSPPESPSIVVIASASCIMANVRQELTLRPLMCTVHAPH